MRLRAHKRPGTTLVELMVCLVFLGLCAGAMINAIGAASRQASVAEEKLLALSVAKSELAKVRAEAQLGGMTNKTTTTNPTDTGIRYPVTVQTSVTRVGGGSSTLFRVACTVSWASDIGPEHSGKVSLETKVVENE